MLRARALLAIMIAAGGCERTAPAPAPMPAPEPIAPRPDHFIERLDQISLVHAEVARGKAADRLMLAVFTGADGEVLGIERPTVAGTFAIRVSGQPGAQTLTLHGTFDADPAAALDIRITETGARDTARLVDPTTGAQTQDLGTQAKVHLAIARDASSRPSEAARLRVASLWALIGENVRTPAHPAELEAAVLGTHLVRQAIPALFHPGDGTWILLKTVEPDELLFAFEVATGRAELFPKAPNEPTASARALFGAL